MSARRLILLALALAAAAAVWGGGSPVANAAAGGGNTGTIYYLSGGAVWRMNPDGTGKAQLPAAVRGTPGFQVHAGRRWFLYAEGPYASRGLFAVREDGLSTVSLFSDAAVDVERAEWNRDDSTVALSAVDRRAGSPAGRLFRLDVAFDANQIPFAAGVPLPVAESGIEVLGNGDTTTRISVFTWSPTADRIAWGEKKADNSGYVVRMTTVASGATTTIASGNGPVWSPDGTRILFLTTTFTPPWWSVATMDPSGANVRAIVHSDSSYALAGPAGWSPDGAAVMYKRSKRSGFPITMDVYRAQATGSPSPRDLTSDVTAQASPIAWR